MADSDPGWVSQVKAIFDAAGVPVGIWFPLMAHESNGYPAVFNDTRGRTDLRPGTVPEYSIGLFQINVHAMGLTPAEEEALAEKLKDPVENARWIAPRIAAAWNYVKANKQAVAAQHGLPAEYGLSGAVAVRAGFPGGSVDHPCVSDYCNEVVKQFAETERQATTAWNTWQAAGGDVGTFLIPWWKRDKTGQPSIYSPGSGAGSGGSGSGSSSSSANGGSGSTTNAGYYGGSSATSPAAAGGITLAQLGSWWATDDHGARVVVFAVGALLLALAVAAIVFEGARKKTNVVIRATARGATGDLAGAADALTGA